MSDFNKKILKRILFDLRDFRTLNLSCLSVEKNVQQNMGALDSTLPSNIKASIELIVLKIADYRQEQYAATLNTIQEGTPDQNLSVGTLFDGEISLIEKYISARAEI